MRRSAISRMPSTPTSRMVPCRNSAGRVDGDGAHHGGPADGAVQVPGERDDRHERGDQPAEAEHQLGGVALLRAAGTPRRARRRRRRRSTISIGRQQAVLDAGCGQVHRAGPSAILGAGSGWSMVVSVWLTAGLITSSAGFGIHAEHQQQRDQRCDDDEFARHQVTQPLVAVRDRAGHHPLVHPQDVDRGQHQRGRREHREHRVARECADQDQEFADERRQAGQRQRRQARRPGTCPPARARPSARRRRRRSAECPCATPGIRRSGTAPRSRCRG